jgi:hypothetical protein
MKTYRAMLRLEDSHHEKDAASARSVALSCFRIGSSGARNSRSRGEVLLWLAATAALAALLQVRSSLAGVISMKLAPLFLHILIASAGTFASIRTRTTRPRLLTGYLAFVAVAGCAGIIAFQFSAHYRFAFWLADMANNLMLMALALEIISDVLPRSLATPWAVFFGSSLVLAIVRQWPATSTLALLNLSISTMATSGLLLLALAFVPEITWPKGYAMAAIGLAAVLAGDLLPSIGWITGAASPLMLQFGDLPGLLILAAGEVGWKRRVRISTALL